MKLTSLIRPGFNGNISVLALQDQLGQIKAEAQTVRSSASSRQI